MRIAIVNRHVDSALGGSEIQCDLLAGGLTARGHEVVYIAPGDAPMHHSEGPYRIVDVSEDPRSILDACWANRPDVVYWRFNLKSFRKVGKELARFRVPIVFAVSHLYDVKPWVWVGGQLGPVANIRELARRRFNRFGFRYVEALTTLNRDLLAMSPVARSYYVPNGMLQDVESFSWPRPYVAWVANIKSSKRPEVFVQAVECLGEHGIDGIMVGRVQSEGYRWLEDSAQTPRNFHYIGPRSPSEVNGILANSEVHVHTCRPEGFGNVFIQAWLQGRPSVSFDYDPGGYISEIGLGSVAGGNMEVFIDQILLYATTPSMVAAAGERAKHFASKTFSAEAMIERVERVLLDSATGPTLPG